MPILGIIASSFRSGAGPTGAYDSLATVTVPSGGVTSITFAGIPGGYKHLELRSTNKAAASSWVVLELNGDTTDTNYVQHRLVGDGGTVNASSFTSGASRKYMFTTYPYWGGGVWSFLDYANTNKYKTIRGLSGFRSTSTTEAEVNFISDLWMNTSAITSIKLSLASTSFSESTRFALYGVK